MEPDLGSNTRLDYKSDAHQTESLRPESAFEITKSHDSEVSLH